MVCIHIIAVSRLALNCLFEVLDEIKSHWHDSEKENNAALHLVDYVANVLVKICVACTTQGKTNTNHGSQIN